MYLTSYNPLSCYGCKACVNACKKDAIRFETSSDTYPYPKIETDKCINCGACKRVCPSQYTEFINPKECFAAVTKNIDDWEKASSGGAFKVLALAAKERCEKQGLNFYLCGCIWGENFKATHKLLKVSCEKDIEVFCKSKYVQSDLLMVYREIKDILKDEKNYVMFSGSPCQVAALKLFIGREGNTRLILIDLICNGAPGQVIFNKYCKGLENEHNSELKDYCFKNKKMLDNGTIYTRSSRMIFKNGEEHLVTRFTDDYLKLFYTAGYHLRPSCYTCQFKRPERVGDITIGDAWNIDKIYPHLNPFHGVSLIVINTVVGGEYKSDIEKRMNVFSLDYHFAVQNNKPLREPEENVAPKIILKEFFTDILDKDKSFKHSAEKFYNAISEFKKQRSNNG